MHIVYNPWISTRFPEKYTPLVLEYVLEFISVVKKVQNYILTGPSI